MSRSWTWIAVAIAMSASASAEPSLTPTKVVEAADARIGETATAIGYFSYTVDTRALWESKHAYLDAKLQRKGGSFDYWTKCITIFPRTGSVRQFNGKRVRVIGKIAIINSGDMRSLWSCNRVALENAVITPE